MEKYYKELLDMPAVKSTKNPDGTGKITESTVNEIHTIERFDAGRMSIQGCHACNTCYKTGKPCTFDDFLIRSRLLYLRQM